MFSHHTSQHTRPVVTGLLSLGLILITLWLLGGAPLPARAWPIETGQFAAPLAPSTILTVTNADDDGPGSLRQAITDANNGDIINFDNDYSIYLSSTLEITKQLMIDGGTYTVTVSGDTGNDGTRNVRVFFITSTAVVTLSHLNIVSGTTYMVNDPFSSGGGIYVNSDSQLTVQSSSLASNIAGFIGGGGIYNAGMLTLTNSIFTGNSALLTGGGVRNAGIVTLQNCIFMGNTSYGNGGGIYNNITSALAVTGSTFVSNTAYGGGGIYNNITSTLAVTGSTFVSNTAYGGGGIAGNGTITLINSIVKNNVADNGGGIFIDGGGQVVVQNSTLSENIADYGGGVLNGNKLTLIDTTLADNIATYSGGGLYTDRALTVTNCTFSGNLAQGSDEQYDGGGAIHQWEDSTGPHISVLDNVTFANNNAPNVPGRDGIWLERGNMTLRNVLLADNDSANCTIEATATFTATADSMADDTSCVGATSVPSTSLTLPPLADNGGSTWTHALLPNSPAIDAGNDVTCLPTDQRGVTRPQGVHCDIGAFEATFTTYHVYLPLVLK